MIDTFYLPSKPEIIIPRAAEIPRPGDPRFETPAMIMGGLGITAIGGKGRAVTGLTYATWNPSDKSASVTLSNGNLTAQVPNNCGVRSTAGKAAGKFYVECTISTGSSGTTIGIAKATATLSANMESDANAWMFYSGAGQKANNNSYVAYGNSYTTGDIIGIAADLDNGKIWWAKNGTWQASGDPAAGTNAAYTGLSGTFFLAASNAAAVAQTTICNFGASAFTYAPPAGFAGWVDP